MAITMQQYYSLIENAAVQVTRSHANWTSFLRTASQLYPYRFPDQLAIYAQRPDATACTSYDKWNQRFHRYVKRGSKGIALLDDRQAYPRLRYVFDIADTDGQQQRPEPWRVQDEQHLALNRALHAQYALDANESLPLTLEDFGRTFRLTLKGAIGHPVELGMDTRGNLTRIDNAISQMLQQLQNQKTMLQTLFAQTAAAREQMGKPFPQEEELRVKSARLAELNTLLNMENRRDAAPAADEPTEKPGRSSVLQRLSTPCPAARTVAKAVPYWEAR